MIRTSRTAFTLIELLAASMLATLLVLVMFQTIASLGRTRSAIARDAGQRSAVTSAWKADLLETLRRDVASAQSTRFEPSRLTLTGNSFLDPRTLAPGDEACTVVYEIEHSSGNGSLVRRQFTSGSSSGARRAWSELLCTNVTRMSMQTAANHADVTTQYVHLRVEGPHGVVLDERFIAR